MSDHQFTDVINPFENIDAKFSEFVGYENIESAGNKTKEFIRALREGEISFLKTGIPELDECLDGGISPNSIVTIGGLSGSGKSALEDNIVTGIVEKNPEKKIVVIHFNYEMLTKSRMLRKVSASLGVNRQEMINKEITPDHEMDNIIGEIEKYKDYPVHYINNALSHATFKEVWDNCKKSLPSDYTVVLSIDHLGLSEKLNVYENDLKMLENFSKMFNVIKKEGELSINPNVVIIALTQLNREIESDSRLNNPSGHAPRSTDIRGGDDLRNISDYVLIQHKPGKMDYRQDAYTKHQLPIEGFLYLHCVKYREGGEFIIQFEDELNYSRFTKAVIVYKESHVVKHMQKIQAEEVVPYYEPVEEETQSVFTKVQGTLANNPNDDLPF